MTIPFIVYTATYVDAADERLARDLGADAFIRKPAEPQAFIAELRKALAQFAGGVPAGVKQRSSEKGLLLQQYSEALIRRLEHKTLQLQESNRALRQEVIDPTSSHKRKSPFSTRWRPTSPSSIPGAPLYRSTIRGVASPGNVFLSSA